MQKVSANLKVKSPWIVLAAAFLFTTAGFGQTTYTVTTTDDSGSGSLRQAMLDAESSSGADIIDATGVSGTITLASALPAITQDLTISGPGAANLAISGNTLYRPFFITGGIVQISDLSIINGQAQGGSPAYGGGGGAGMGGGLYIDAGSLVLNSVTFSGNSAVGGNSTHYSGYNYGVAGGEGPLSASGGSSGYSTSSYQGGTGGNGSFGGGGGSGGYGRFAGGAGGNGGYGGGAGAVGSKYDGTSGAWSTVYPGSPGQFGGTSTTSVFAGGDTYCRSGGGGAGLGGALFARSGSTVSINSCTFTGNSATGGTAGTGGSAGQGKAGAIFVHPGAVVSADGITFSSNSAANDADDLTDNDDFYGELASAAPMVSTSGASDVSFTTVTLNGSVNPNGYATSVKFQYGTSSTLETYTETSPVSAGAGSSFSPVSQALSGLNEAVTYYFRVAATNEKGTSTGAIKSVTTLRSPRPILTLNEATNIGGGTATLSGTVSPNGTNTSYKFQYATNPSFVGAVDAGNGTVSSSYSINSAGNAIQLGGSKFVSIPDNGTLDLGDHFTLEAWIYQNAAGYNTILDKGDYRYLFDIDYNKIGFYSSGTGTGWAHSDEVIPVGEWVHVAVTYDKANSEIKFYKNGALINTVSGTLNSMTPDNGDINIGRQQPSSCGCNIMNGSIDEVRIWNVARTETEISENYTNGLSGTETGLKAYWQFNETSGTTVSDLSGNGNTGTTQNSPSFVASGATVNQNSKNVSVALTGLSSSEYFFRLTATNSTGSETTAAKTFQYKAPARDLVLWVRADSGVTQDGSGFVSSWVNLAPGGGNVVQATNSYQPKLITGQVNGKPVIRFDGSDDHMESPSITMGPGVTVITVIKTTTTARQRFISDQNYLIYGFENNALFSYGGNGGGWNGGGSSVSVPINQFNIVAMTHDGSTSRGYVNGTTTANLAYARSSHTGPVQIGAYNLPGYGIGEMFAGDVAEILIFNKLLSEEERKTIEGRLMMKYHTGAKDVVSNPAVPSGGTGGYVLGNTGATVTFTDGSETGGTIEATTSTSPSVNGDLPIGIQGLATEKYWTITNTGLTGFTYSITLDLTGISGITDFNSIKVVKRDDENAVWADVTGAPYFATVIHDNPYITISGLSSFSEFAVGTSGENPLPVELVSFTGKLTGGKVSLTWSTRSETTNYGWEIQKMQEAVVSRQESVAEGKWETIGFVAGKGTTTEAQTYTFTSASGSGKFRLKQIDTDGSVSFSQVLSFEQIPSVLTLNQNYPNPFNPSTVIGFALPVSGKVSMKIYDVTGRELATLLNRDLESGSHSVTFDASGYAAGVYFCKLAFNGQVVTKKLTLLK